STSSKRTIAGESIAARAAAYAIPGVRVDGNDVLAVYEAVNTAVARARAGEGPTLVEALTYRWGGHSMRANLPDYRTKEEEREWMARDERVFVMGEDVSLIGGIFGVTRGLREKFGEDRVRDTPISEAGFLGAGVGAAVAGLRPVVEIQIWDFIAVAMDQVVNQAAKFRYMLGGGPTVPLVIRGPQGGGIRLAAQHSQSLEAWFAHVPGLVVVAPSTPYDAKGLLASAIRDDNPVIFLEHKAL